MFGFWLKRRLKNRESIWYFIPNHFFLQKWRSFFYFKITFLPNKLPINLSKFHQQALLAWKLDFVHNVCPHKTFLWNSFNILIRKKSLFISVWFQRGLNHILNLFDESGDMLSYEHFMNVHSFPIPFREFNSLTRAIPNGLILLIQNHLS